jgi:2-dehydropantoate 2-reductase
MDDNGVRGRPSMHDDLLRNRACEVDESIGEFVRAAERLGVAAPALLGAYRIIRGYQALMTEEAPVDVYP